MARPESSTGVASVGPTTPFEDSVRATHQRHDPVPAAGVEPGIGFGFQNDHQTLHGLFDHIASAETPVL